MLPLFSHLSEDVTVLFTYLCPVVLSSITSRIITDQIVLF
jgi:hypothetical protein